MKPLKTILVIGFGVTMVLTIAYHLAQMILFPSMRDTYRCSALSEFFGQPDCAQVKDFEKRLAAMDENAKKEEAMYGNIKMRLMPDQTRLIIVKPKDASLPDNFIKVTWSVYDLKSLKCLDPRRQDYTCYAAMIDLNRDNIPEILILADDSLHLFAHETKDWPQKGAWSLTDEQRDAFISGDISNSRPIYDDIIVSSNRLNVGAN